MVSIIYPIINSDAVLAAALSSLSNQTHKEIEIIIIYDTLLEHQEKAIRKIENRKVRISLHPCAPNTSRVSAFCQGALLAQGEYLFFIDTLDYVMESYLEDLLRVFKKDPQITIATTSFRRHVHNRPVGGNTYSTKILAGPAKFDLREPSYYRLWNMVVERNFFLETMKLVDFNPHRTATLAVALLARCQKYYRHGEVLYFRGHPRAAYHPPADATVNAILQCAEFDLPKKAFQNLIIDELLVGLSYAMLTNQSELDYLPQIVELTKLHVPHLIRHIILMPRPLIYKRAAINLINQKHKAALSRLTRYFSR